MAPPSVGYPRGYRRVLPSRNTVEYSVFGYRRGPARANQPQPSEVTEVLARLDVPLVDRHDIAINLMKQGDTAAAARRAARRAALIAGEPEPVNETAAA